MTQSIETRVRLTLPDSLIDEYEKQADEARLSLEEILEERLEQTVEAKDNRPIYFSDAERHELDELLGINVTTASQIVSRVRSALSLKIGGEKLSTRLDIKPSLLTRLRSRCFIPDFEQFLKKTITEGLETFAGLR